MTVFLAVNSSTGAWQHRQAEDQHSKNTDKQSTHGHDAAARNMAPVMAKCAMDELAMYELAKKVLVREGFAIDELATDALPQLLASELVSVPLVDLQPLKETMSI